MKTKFKIVVENSAPSQKRAAKSVSWAAPVLRELGVTCVVDVGCGRLRNLDVFQRSFSDITLVDTKLQFKRIKDLVPKSQKIRLLDAERFRDDKRRYHAAFIISVLHILPDRKTRKRVISLAIRKLCRFGYIVVDVPTGENYYRHKCKAENKYRDGWLMGEGKYKTFYKKYSARELDKLLTDGMHLELYKKVWFDKHIVRIMKKLS